MITTFYPPYNFGGDGIFVHSLAHALADRGHEVEVVHCEDAYRLGNSTPSSVQIEKKGIKVHRLRSHLGLLSPLITQLTGLPGLKRNKLQSILERDFDVVNFHNISLVGGPGVLGMSRAPVNLYTLHEHWLLCPTHIFWKNGKEPCENPQCFSCCLRSGIPPQLWRYTPLVEHSLKNIDMLLSPSEYTARRHRDEGVTTPIKVLPTFSTLVHESIKYCDPPKRPTFLYVGRVTASKGIHILLEDFTVLEDYYLYVVGDGELRLSLQSEYAEFKNIRFTGMVPQTELTKLYQSATAIILPSLAPEVFPLTTLEAFACGTPAIVRDAGGNREPLDRTGAGFVYDSREDFYKAVHSLAKNPNLREELGRNAREGYERYYSVERYLNSYLGLIDFIKKKKDATFS